MLLRTLEELKMEIGRARAKHPEANFLALIEEVGEVAKAMLEGDMEHARVEVLQVATVAVRMYEEGLM